MSRIAKALNSADLTHHEQPCDVDVLQATGATSMRKPLGVLIVEAMEGAAGDGPHAASRVRDLQRALEPTVQRIAQRWGLKVNVMAVCALVVREIILDRCPKCEGRGFLPIRRYDGRRAAAGDAGDTREAECTTCLGSGSASRDYQARAKAAGLETYTSLLGELWDALLECCAHAEFGARASVSRRLHRDP